MSAPWFIDRFLSKAGLKAPGSEEMKRNFRASLTRVIHKQSLGADEMTEAMELIVSGLLSDGDIERFLLALSQKGETAEEIGSAAGVMRHHAVKLPRPLTGLLDTCGTGGDGKQTFNVSTLAALTACALGARVAKHGNRSVSGVCGSADLLEALGVRIELSPDAVTQCIEATGFGFFFAPIYHPATRHAMPARKRIKEKTLFNLLGPLANPAGASRQLLGVYDARLVGLFAQVLRDLGSERAMVVHGNDGVDEISLSDVTQVAEIVQGQIRSYTLTPEDVGLARAPIPACASKEESIALARRVLEGERGPAQDAVAFNAGAALAVADLAADVRTGTALAREALASGRVLLKTSEIAARSQKAEA